MIELKALSLRWLEDSDAQRDLCAHSEVYLRIGDYIISDENSGDWAVSATAYLLLKTLKTNSNENSPIQLLPHCGFTMWEIGEEKDLYICGCDIGINWNITHSKDKVIHEIAKDKFIETPFNKWRDAICKFSDEITKFYEISSPKIIEDEEDKKGFNLFMKEWKRLRAEAFK